LYNNPGGNAHPLGREEQGFLKVEHFLENVIAKAGVLPA
jgi:hypothetical protein